MYSIYCCNKIIIFFHIADLMLLLFLEFFKFITKYNKLFMLLHEEITNGFYFMMLSEIFLDVHIFHVCISQ